MSVVNLLIALMLLIAIYGAFRVSRRDWIEKDVCPKLMRVPACYVVLVFFLIALVLHVMLLASVAGVSALWVAGAILVPSFLALAGTLLELAGHKICPRSSNGIPMCFVSLGFCVGLLFLHFL